MVDTLNLGSSADDAFDWDVGMNHVEPQASPVRQEPLRACGTDTWNATRGKHHCQIISVLEQAFVELSKARGDGGQPADSIAEVVGRRLDAYMASDQAKEWYYKGLILEQRESNLKEILHQMTRIHEELLGAALTCTQELDSYFELMPRCGPRPMSMVLAQRDYQKALLAQRIAAKDAYGHMSLFAKNDTL